VNAIFGVIESKNAINLIHGPPGTGKTHTIVSLLNILQELELGDAKPNILLCAPSNGAIDELVFRVLNKGFINKLTGINYAPKIVRIGKSSEKQVNKLVNSVTLE